MRVGPQADQKRQLGGPASPLGALPGCCSVCGIACIEGTAGRKTCRSGLFRPGRVRGLSEPKCLFRHYSLLVATVLEHRLVTPGEVAEPSLAPFHVYLVADWLSKASSFPGLQLADLTVLQPTQQIPNSKWVASLLPSLGLASAAVWLKDLRASQLQPSFAVDLHCSY